MDLRLKLILAGVLALLLGLAFSSPLLFSNLKPATNIELIVDVKYAYFGDQVFSQGMLGLWRNASSPQENEQQLVSYIIVLNITNNSNKLAYVDEFEAAAGPNIVATNNTLSMQDRIVDDVRTIEYFPGWGNQWEPNESRLIAVTGTASVPQTFMFQTSPSGTIYLYGRVQAKAFGSTIYSTSFGLKQVHVQQNGQEFLYNALISENQLLQINNGFDVYVESFGS